MRQWLVFIIFFGLILTVLVFGKHFIQPASLLGSAYGEGKRPNWPDKAFSIGTPERYSEPGVYFDFAKSHGIYIVNHADMLVALSVDNPANNRATQYDNTTGQFTDPSAGVRFTSNGLITGISGYVRRTLDDPDAVRKALDDDDALPRSLERCYIKLMGDPADPEAQLQVRPRHRFIQELNQWSRQYSVYQLK